MKLVTIVCEVNDMAITPNTPRTLPITSPKPPPSTIPKPSNGSGNSSGSSGGRKLPSYAPPGSYYNNSGKLVNKQGQLLNDKGQAVNKQGQLINANNQPINQRGQRVNDKGQAINDKGHLIDAQGRLVNPVGRLVNTEGHLIDRDGKRVNRDGILVDKTGRPLDKDGKVARDKTSAAKGNNEPHEQLLPPKLTQRMLEWKNKAPTTPGPPKMTIAEATTRMVDATKFVKDGIIPSSPSAGIIARDAAISAVVTGVISAPLNIGTYAGSTSASERIKASYLPQPLVPPTPIAKSSVDRPTESEQPDLETLYPRINDAQVTGFAVANTSAALEYGETKVGLIPGQTWPKDPLERMDQLEALLDYAEEHTAPVAEGWKVFFKPHLADKPAAPGMEGLEDRIATIEERISVVNEAQKTILEKMNKSQPVS